MEISKGDAIRYLNSQGGGTVTGFCSDGKILVLDNNIGMEIPVERSECVVVSGVEGMAKNMKMHYVGGVGVKKAADSGALPKPKPKELKISAETGVLEVDLHINASNTNNYINTQLDKCRRTLNEHRKQKGLKVVFIHGKGDGTLRLQLIKLIMKEYPTFSFSDASFTKYGMYGATEVTIQ